MLIFLCRQIRSKLPGFRPGISALNVGRAADVLKKLDYHGPLALSWDDTALEAAISIHAESKDVCLILGAVEGVIRVTEQNDLDDLFEKAQLQKADKVRY
jgi:basic membrane lipoprotein Med (substrate-binding protein (PBP1-ABC) superfamily)